MKSPLKLKGWENLLIQIFIECLPVKAKQHRRLSVQSQSNRREKIWIQIQGRIYHENSTNQMLYELTVRSFPVRVNREIIMEDMTLKDWRVFNR